MPPRGPEAQDSLVELPETRYAKTSDGVHLAYQTVGEGPIDLVWQFDLIFGNVEITLRFVAPRAHEPVPPSHVVRDHS